MHTTLSLARKDNYSDRFSDCYSRFKHGSKTQARIFGKEVSMVCDFPENSSLVFYSAPHNNIPTASNAFKDYLLSACAGQFLKKQVSIKQGKVNREYSYDEDYGKMSKEERAKAISSDLFKIDKSIIEADDILVFVDDIKITGSHEDRIKELIERENITNEFMFIYMVEYTGIDASIEHRLNHHSVKDLKDINDIIRNEEFIFNTRVVKFILNSDIEHFVSFITYQSHSFRETLFSLSILNNYHINPKYKTNFDILKNIIQ